MLRAPLLRGRIRQQTWISVNVLCRCRYANVGKEKSARRRGLERKTRETGVKKDDEDRVPKGNASKNTEPSLYEQLFPDQHQRDDKKQPESEIPRLPVDPIVSKPVPVSSPIRSDDGEDGVHRSASSRQLRREMTAQGIQTSVLVLRNASKNLVEEDFKRLIPQGRHLDGWTMEEGDILRVIPGRELRDLSRTGDYYLLFSSPLSAFTYQGHATRIHRMVAAHTPASVVSAVPPPPGYMIEGMDAHAAIESFSLTAPTQSLDLRQLKPPLTPAMQSMVKLGGYACLVKRKDRMPYEARLTFEGPQPPISIIRHILISRSQARGLGWSGGDDLAPKISKWEFRWTRGMLSETSDIGLSVSASAPETSTAPDDSLSGGANESQMEQLKRRTSRDVFTVGFATESAMQSFVHFWHRRPMERANGQAGGFEEEDLPPVANVEVLW